MPGTCLVVSRELPGVHAEGREHHVCWTSSRWGSTLPHAPHTDAHNSQPLPEQPERRLKGSLAWTQSRSNDMQLCSWLKVFAVKVRHLHSSRTTVCPSHLLQFQTLLWKFRRHVQFHAPDCESPQSGFHVPQADRSPQHCTSEFDWRKPRSA